MVSYLTRWTWERSIIYPERCLQSQFVWDECWQKDYQLYAYNILYPWSMVCTIQSWYTFNNMRASKAVKVSVKSFRASDAMTVFQEHACGKRNDNLSTHACSKRNDSPLRTCVQQTQGQSFKNMRAANVSTFSGTPFLSLTSVSERFVKDYPSNGPQDLVLDSIPTRLLY